MFPGQQVKETECDSRIPLDNMEAGPCPMCQGLCSLMLAYAGGRMTVPDGIRDGGIRTSSVYPASLSVHTVGL